MANTDRNFGLVVNQAVKNPCRAATTANITRNGLLTIDDVTLVEGDRVLVKNQSDPVENGIYVADTGDWNRALDCDGPFDLVTGTFTKVLEGTVNQGFWEVTTTGNIVVGVDGITWDLASAALAVVSGFIQGLLNDASASVARSTLELNAGQAGDIWIEKAGDTATGIITLSGGCRVNDSSFFIRSNTDNTRALAILCGGIGSATTRNRYNVNEDAIWGATWDPIGVRVNVSVAGNAMTGSVRDINNVDINPVTPGIFRFSSTVITSGSWETVVGQSATSGTMSSGSTMGTVSGQAARLYFGVANDGGTLRFFWYNPWDNTNQIHRPLDDAFYQTSVAEGGAGAADSPLTLYSGTAFTLRGIKVLGYVEITQATAGTWATAPAKVVLLRDGARRPGETVQRTWAPTGSLVTGAGTATPIDDTVPQSSEGSSMFAGSVTPFQAQNILKIRAVGQLSNATTANLPIAMALHTTVNSSALVAAKLGSQGSTDMRTGILETQILAGTTNSQTYTFRAGTSAGTTVYLNGESTARLFGGVSNSFMDIEEIFT